MLNSIRQGGAVYMLRTSQPELAVEQGTVETTSAQMLGMGVFSPYPLDLTVRIGSRAITYRGIPGNADTAPVREQSTGEEIILASSPEAIDREVERLKQESLTHLNRVEFHQQRILSCDRIHSQLHPEEAAKLQQQKEIETMRSQIAALSEQLGMLTEINKQLLEKQGEQASPSPKTEKPK